MFANGGWCAARKTWKKIRYNSAKPFYCSRPAHNNMILVHKYTNRCNNHRYPLFACFFIKFCQWLFWPFRVIELSTKFAFKAQGVDRSNWKQLRDILRLSRDYSLPPKAYYNYAFYQSTPTLHAVDFLYDHEVSTLFPLLNGFSKQKEVRDKYAFSTLCQLNNIPSPETLSVISMGQCHMGTEPSDIQQCEFFVKPRFGTKGKGCQSWSQVDSKQLIDATGRLATKEAVSEEIRLASFRQTLLIQARLKSHSQLTDLAQQNLCSVRIITVLRTQQQPEYFMATLKIPRKQDVTNTSGLISAIDEETGILGRAYTYKLVCQGMDKHPDNQALITGRHLPDWQETIRLALRAHQLFPNYLFLGWDIALTENGPVVLETNECWDALTVQRAHQQPLGKTAFVDICLERLASLKADTGAKPHASLQ